MKKNKQQNPNNERDYVFGIFTLLCDIVIASAISAGITEVVTMHGLVIKKPIITGIIIFTVIFAVTVVDTAIRAKKSRSIKEEEIQKIKKERFGVKMDLIIMFGELISLPAGLILLFPLKKLLGTWVLLVALLGVIVIGMFFSHIKKIFKKENGPWDEMTETNFRESVITMLPPYLAVQSMLLLIWFLKTQHTSIQSFTIMGISAGILAFFYWATIYIFYRRIKRNHGQ